MGFRGQDSAGRQQTYREGSAQAGPDGCVASVVPCVQLSLSKDVI
jgi:hypothetical protein